MEAARDDARDDARDVVREVAGGAAAGGAPRAASGPARRGPGRRAALLLPAALLAWPVAAGAAAGTAQFRIMRSGSQIGTHQISVSRSGNGVEARGDVQIAVRLAGFTVFRYAHLTAEIWQGDRLRSFTSHQDRNGRVSDVTVRAEGGGLTALLPAGPVRLPAEAAPLTWWNPAVLTRPLFDGGTGQPLQARAQRLPDDNGHQHWRVTGDAEGEAWYDRDDTLVGFVTKGDDGSTVTYERA
ncbi:DUF6134 family protein [Roseomonas sp. NAR14]|uniref:DUF6134 family protein n=1 Tax=Roseomonas acroporae TaxID=2937791 RepID=A0A9X2BW73_9PROT|nr:DUF6134 family protein [Roseomonas acroporae]MCK8787468.1 DUF6134 family protein [Roseomonas acroporae]